MSKFKPQTRSDRAQSREDAPAKKPTTLQRVFVFTDGLKIKAKNYADALQKRNKMIGAPPMSKSLDDSTK